MARGRGGHRFRAMGVLDLKGLPEPLAACEVEWEPPPTPADQLPFPHSLVVRSPLAFVGREKELVTAERHLGDTEGLALLWIVGEPGIGKTRLAAELALRAHEGGANVLFGRCDEELSVPFQPFVAALRDFVASIPPSDLLERLGHHAAELTRLLPDLASLVPGPEPAPPAEPEIERYRLFEAVRSWLAAAAEVRPLLLVLDDLHWAAAPTLSLLTHLARSADPVALGVVGTARDTEPGTERLQALLDELAPLPASRAVDHTCLPVAGVSQLVEAATGRSPVRDPTGLARQIHAETAGNPLFVEAVLTGLEPGVEEAELPADVAAAVRRRLSRLSPAAQNLLRVGAVAGLEFDLRVLSRVLGADDASTVDAAGEAARAHLAEEVGVNRYRFAHALVRNVLRQQVGPTRAARDHGRIGEALERVHHGRLDDHADELAYHFGEAAAAGGAIDQALRYTLRAGELAAAQYASETAAGHFRRSLDLLEGAGRAGERAHCEVLVALGEALVHSGDFEGARERLRQAVAEAQAGDWPELAAEAAALRIRHALAGTSGRGGDGHARPGGVRSGRGGNAFAGQCPSRARPGPGPYRAGGRGSARPRAGHLPGPAPGG